MIKCRVVYKHKELNEVAKKKRLMHHSSPLSFEPGKTKGEFRLTLSSPYYKLYHSFKTNLKSKESLSPEAKLEAGSTEERPES